MNLDQLAIRAARRNAVAAFVVIALALMAAGYWYCRHETERISREKYAFLESIGGLKAGQIEQWRKERASDAHRLAAGSYLKQMIAGFLADPTQSPHRAELLDRFELEQRESGYHDILLLASDGELLLTTESTPAISSSVTREAIALAVADPNAVVSDFFRETDGVIHIDTIAAVRDASGKALAVVVLRHHADDYLYPLIRSWPTPSRTAETLLVRRDGEQVVFLNELRHRTNAALSPCVCPLREQIFPRFRQ
jgi:hypothetical protein